MCMIINIFNYAIRKYACVILVLYHKNVDDTKMYNIIHILYILKCIIFYTFDAGSSGRGTNAITLILRL